MRFASELVGNASINLADAALWRGDLGGAEPHLAAVAAILADRRNEWMTWRYGMHYDLTAAEFCDRARRSRARPPAHRELPGGGAAHALAPLRGARHPPARRLSRRRRRSLPRLSACCATPCRAGADARATPRSSGTHCSRTDSCYAALGRRDEAASSAREGLEVASRVASTLPPEIQSAFRGSAVYTGLEELTALSQ